MSRSVEVNPSQGTALTSGRDWAETRGIIVPFFHSLAWKEGMWPFQGSRCFPWDGKICWVLHLSWALIRPSLQQLHTLSRSILAHFYVVQKYSCRDLCRLGTEVQVVLRFLNANKCLQRHNSVSWAQSYRGSILCNRIAHRFLNFWSIPSFSDGLTDHALQ